MGKLMMGTSAIAPAVTYVQEVEGMPSYIPTSKGYTFDNNTLTSYDLLHNQYSTYPAKDIGTDILSRAFSKESSNEMGEVSFNGDPNLVAVDLDSLLTVTGDRAMYAAFAACENLATISIANLKSIKADSVFARAFCGTWQYMDEETWEEKPGIHPAYTSLSFPELEEIEGDNVFEYTFWCCENLTSVTFPKLKKITGDWVFKYTFGYSQIPSIEFTSLEEVNGDRVFSSAFVYSGQTSPATGGKTGPAIRVTYPALKKVTGDYTMYNTYSYRGSDITTFALPNLQYVEGTCAMGSLASNNVNLVNVDLGKLETVKGDNAMSYFFSGCTSLTEISFPSLKNDFGTYKTQFNKMLNNCTGVTVHFPSNLQSVLSSWSDVSSGFGGTSTTVLYDLPVTA